ncbi:MAG: protoheme IX farnesyltransferase [Bacteroidota bacterium]
MPNNPLKIVSLSLELGKVRIALPIALSAATGYVIEKGSLNPGFLFPFFAVLMLGCGAMALNQVQERSLDAKMKRTANRPLVSGRMSLSLAVIIIICYFVIGNLILLITSGWLALSLGILTILWYNLVYTPLKRKTAFAAVPGSVVGALPPVIGWVCAGGHLGDHRVWMLAAFFFIGQIPHFWLLLLKLGDDYAQGGLPTLNSIFTQGQIQRLSFIWIFWAAVMALFLAFFGVITNFWVGLALVTGAVVVVLSFVNLLKPLEKKPNYGFGFMKLNFFYLYVMILLWIDAVV